jgi:hypothetical protein
MDRSGEKVMVKSRCKLMAVCCLGVRKFNKLSKKAVEGSHEMIKKKKAFIKIDVRNKITINFSARNCCEQAVSTHCAI